jgi:hypothetical protein
MELWKYGLLESFVSIEQLMDLCLLNSIYQLKFHGLQNKMLSQDQNITSTEFSFSNSISNLLSYLLAEAYVIDEA